MALAAVVGAGRSAPPAPPASPTWSDRARRPVRRRTGSTRRQWRRGQSRGVAPGQSGSQPSCPRVERRNQTIKRTTRDATATRTAHTEPAQSMSEPSGGSRATRSGGWAARTARRPGTPTPRSRCRSAGPPPPRRWRLLPDPDRDAGARHGGAAGRLRRHRAENMTRAAPQGCSQLGACHGVLMVTGCSMGKWHATKWSALLPTG